MKHIEDIKTICNVGCGTMGVGTAIIFAQSGYEVNMFGRKDASIERAMKNIHGTLDFLKANDLLSEEDGEKLLSRIHGVTTLKDAAAGADFVIESVAEDIKVKQAVYAELESYLGPDVVFATDSSGLLPTEIAATFQHPERFVVTHFLNPAHLMPLVEVVPGEKTAPETVDIAFALMEKIGKKPVKMLKEALGFVTNRLQYAMLREAMYCIKAGIATPEAIDAICKYGFGRRLAVTGPLETVDLAGVDIFYNVSSYLNADLNNDTEPAEALKKCVEAGRLGAKTGAGLYDWTPESLEKIKRTREEVLVEWLKKDASGQKF